MTQKLDHSQSDRTRQEMQKMQDEIERLRARVVELEAENARLYEGEDRLRLLQFALDHARDAIYWIDEMGRIFYANDAACRDLGYTCDNLLSMHIWDIDPNMGEEDWPRHWNNLKRRPGWIVEVEQQRKDGSILPVELSTSYMQYKESAFVCSFVRDVSDRREAATFLIESERRYRNLAHNMSDVVIVMRPDGTLLYVSPSAEGVFGCDPEAFLQLRDRDFILPEDLDRINAEHGPLSERTSWRVQYRARRQDGRTIWIEESGRRITQKGEPLQFVLVCRDVTEHKRDRQALAESEARYRLLAENVTDVISTMTLDGKFLYISPAIEALTGHTPAERMQLAGYDTVHPEDRERLRQVMARLRAGEERIRVEYRILHKDGHYVWVESIDRLLYDEATGEPQIITATRDVTERREAERAIRESEARYRLLAENVTDVISSSAPDGSFVYISPSIENLIGRTPEEMIQMGSYFNIHPEDRDKVAAVVERLLEGDKYGLVEYRVRHKDGHYVWVESTSRLIRDAATGEPQEIITVSRDISERKRAEESLRAYSERVQIMYEIDKAILAAQSPDAIARAVLDRLWQLVGCDQSAVIIFDYEAETARMLAMQLYDVTRTMPEAELPLHFFDYVTQGVYDEPEPRQGAMTDIHLEDIGFPLVQYGLVLYANVPLVVHGQMIGILNMCRDHDEAFSAQQMEIAAEVADSLAVAVYQARLQEALRDNMAHLQESLREKEVLLQEIHHRVKNNLQVVSSLLNLQKGNINDRDIIATLEESRSRVKAMALVHEWLYRSEDFARINFADYLRSLTAHLFSTYNVDAQRVRLEIKGKDFALSIDQAVPCGLIINEIVTNALAHAFPDAREGRITVSLESKGRRRELTISDDGVGLPEDVNWHNTQTLGLQLISILTQQMGGTVKVDRTNGTAFHITFVQPDSS